jgi:PKD repeat protein
MISAYVELYKQGETGPSGESGLFSDVTPITVQFKAVVTGGSPTVYHWDFGDGETADIQEPLHTYSSYGSHRVVLTTTDEFGEYVSPFYVVVLGKLDFSADVVRGQAPLTVRLTENSVAPSGFVFSDKIWNFGDGSTGIVSDPTTHVYTEHGKYSITLSAKLHT